MPTSDPQLAALLADDLRQRGPEGAAVLGALLGHSALSPPLDALLAEARALAEPPDVTVDDGPVVLLPEVGRVVLVGDLHGRYDRAEDALRHARVVDEAGRWVAPAGTLVVFVGDLVDADFAWDLPRHADPRGDAAWATYSHIANGWTGGRREAFEALSAVDATTHDALTRQARLDVLGASWVLSTLESVRRLAGLAEAAGGRVVVLTGNHELDLWSGRLWWYGDQKRALLRLLGVAAPDALVATLRAAPDRAAALDALDAVPLLGWLARSPWVLRAGPVLAMHGGPTRRLTDTLLGRDIDRPALLARWLSLHDNTPFHNDFFGEGSSLFAPSTSSDAVARDGDLVLPWLAAAGADLLAVGHSPFLGFPPGEWVDTTNPAVMAAVHQVERLGPIGHLLALDTGLKRGERAEVVRLDRERGELVAIADDGVVRGLLRRGEALDRLPSAATAVRLRRRLLDGLDAVRQPGPGELVQLGVDGRAWMRLFDTLDGLERDGHDLAALRDHVTTLLRAGPATLDLLQRRVLAASADGWAALERHREAVTARANALARRVTEQGGEVIRLAPGLAERTVDGEVYRMVDLVVEGIDDPREVFAVELSRDGGHPAALLRQFAHGRLLDELTIPLSPQREGWTALQDAACAALDAWLTAPRDSSPERAPQVSTERSARPSAQPRPSTPAVEPCAARLHVPVSVLTRLLDANRQVLGVSEPSPPPPTVWAPRAAPAWAPLPGPWRRLSVVWSAQRWLMLADLAFVDPALRTTGLALDEEGVVTARPHTELLLGLLARQEAVALFASLKPEVVRHLDAGEPERLGLGGTAVERRAPWRNGRFLFASTSSAAARDHHAHNGVRVEFSLDHTTLTQFVRVGWLNLGLFVGDAGQVLDPSRPVGLDEVAIEVIGIGQRGVQALWEHRVR